MVVENRALWVVLFFLFLLSLLLLLLGGLGLLCWLLVALLWGGCSNVAAADVLLCNAILSTSIIVGDGVELLLYIIFSEGKPCFSDDTLGWGGVVGWGGVGLGGGGWWWGLGVGVWVGVWVGGGVGGVCVCVCVGRGGWGGG